MKAKILLSASALCLGTIFVSAETITVKTAEEFIKAIGPNREIVIESDDDLLLTPVVQKLVEKDLIPEYRYGFPEDNTFTGVGFFRSSNGPGLAVVGCPNLTITPGYAEAYIKSTPRDAEVIIFQNCQNLKIEKMVMGHTDDGICNGAVLAVSDCAGVAISDCKLYGCGTEGIVVSRSSDVTVSGTQIYGCSYHTLHVLESQNIAFKDCIFRDNREFDQINIIDCENVAFIDCAFIELQGLLFNVENPTTFLNCKFDKCEYNPSETTTMVNCKVTNEVK